MLEENKNNKENDFQDFDDSVSDNIEMDNDLSGIDEDKVEQALRNVVSQMMSEPGEEEHHQDNKDSDKETIEKSKQQEDNDSSQVQIQNQEEEIQKEVNKEEIKEEVKEEVNEEIKEEVKEEVKENKEDSLSQQQEENLEQKEQQQASEQNASENKQETEVSKWEELDDKNCVVKKYIIYISKDFIPYIDNMSTDERSAYINDAIQCKLDIQDEQKQIEKNKNAFVHFMIAVLIFIILTPFALLLAHKSIIATFDNYKYSQENFEKLYKHRFEKDKAYMRSLQYNKEYEKRAKKSK